VSEKSAIAVTNLDPAERRAWIVCSGWTGLSLIFFGVGLLFGADSAEFMMLASLLKAGAFLIATVLCWRSASNPDILSGQSVWSAIALGLLFYTLGDITVILWRSLWGITSTVSLGDVFYGASYLFLVIGLLQAVFSRQIKLSLPQSIGIAITGITGILLASWICFYLPNVEAIPAQPAFPSAMSTTTISITNTTTRGTETRPALTPGKLPVPQIVQTLETRLSRIARYLGLVYVGGDCLLIVIAVALLISFWGGSYSKAWKLVAIAGLCLYIADMFLMYEVGRGTYRPVAPWEIFWILSALFFGLSAGVEQGVASQVKRRWQPPS